MKLFYRKFGSGHPIIILHGLLGASDNWVTIAKGLSDKYEVFIPDLRNHGQSPHSPIFNYNVLAGDLLEFFDDRLLSKAALIGHSMGGKIAMNFTLEHPQRVAKLVVIDISPGSYPVRNIHDDVLNAMASVNFDLIRSREEVDLMLRQTINSEQIRLLIMKNLYRIGKSRWAWRINLEAINENITEISRELVHTAVFPGSVMFIKGGRSDYIQQADEANILKYFPDAIIETIEKASHWVHSDAPEEMHKLMDNFLENKCSCQNQPQGI